MMIIIWQKWQARISYLMALSLCAIWWYDDYHMIIWWSWWGYDDQNMIIWWSLYEDMMGMTCSQSHILPENIWFVRSITIGSFRAVCRRHINHHSCASSCNSIEIWPTQTAPERQNRSKNYIRRKTSSESLPFSLHFIFNMISRTNQHIKKKESKTRERHYIFTSV